LEIFVFVEGGKLENQEKTLRVRQEVAVALPSERVFSLFPD